MKKLRIVIFVIVGGILGLGVHLIWHSSTGVDLSSFGPHVTQGVVFTLAGGIIGGLLHSIISKK